MAGRKQKKPDKGKGKDTSSGLEADDAEGGMNPEVDLAGDGDMDDENARRKIKIEYIEDKSRRHITFSKRKAGIMKKVSFAFERISLGTHPLRSGIRAFNSDRDAGPPSGGVRDGIVLYVHDSQNVAHGDSASGATVDSSE